MAQLEILFVLRPALGFIEVEGPSGLIFGPIGRIKGSSRNYSIMYLLIDHLKGFHIAQHEDIFVESEDQELLEQVHLL